MKYKVGDYVKIILHPKVTYYRNQVGLIAEIIDVYPIKKYPYIVRFLNGRIKGRTELFDDKCLRIANRDEVMVELL